MLPDYRHKVGRRGHKYGAKATVVDGIRFDSKLEARHYERLVAGQKQGRIRMFLRQVPLHLPGGTKLVIDFLVFWEDGMVSFEDAKGMETDAFKTKRREVEQLYDIELTLITK
jgi:hypothetical protein